MSSSLDKIEIELQELGFATTRFTSPHGEVVAVSYVIDVGRLSRTSCQLGFSMQEQGFPIYAPHWIHVAPPIDDKQGSGRQYNDEHGTLWAAFSRPPTYWDNLPNKSIKTFLHEHVRRFFANDV